MKMKFWSKRPSAPVLPEQLLASLPERFRLPLRFDDVLVDFVLSAELCSHQGHIVLDDMWMTSIQGVVRFIRTNRLDFSEVLTPIQNIAAFKKVSDDQRRWDYHVSF